MTKQQFDLAVALARSDKDLDTILDGCGLKDFQPVTITLEVAAKFIRWQCFYLNGQICPEELNETRNISKKKWLVCS